MVVLTEESGENDFNKNDVDVEDNVEADEGVEDEEEEQSNDSKSIEVWAQQIPKKNTATAAVVLQC